MTQIELFQYSQINETDRVYIQDRTVEIKALAKRSAQDIIDIGLKLIEVKERLPHGMWGQWLDSEFGWTDRNARRFMNVASKSDKLSDLENFGQSALYLLASPSTPDEAINEAIDRAGNGEAITHKVAKEIVTSYKKKDAVVLVDDERSPGFVNSPLFECPECDQTFNSEVWHCLFCNHHWQLNQRDCPNCYKVKLNKKETMDMKRIKRDAPQVFEQVMSAELTITEAKKKTFETDSAKLAQPMQVLLSHKELEYYTPSEYTETARTVMGYIDLDPASSEMANKTVKAKAIFTQDDNGLNKEWFGKVWLNPPYSKSQGKSNQELWANKLIDEYQKGNVKEGVLLVKAALGYKWFEALFENWPVCLATKRLSFTKTDGTNDGQSKHGTAFFYFGKNLDGFIKEFSKWGCIIDQRKGNVYPRK